VENEYTHKGGGTYYNSVAGLSLDPDNFETIYILHKATNNRSELDRPTKAVCDTLLTLPGADALMARRILKTSESMGLAGTQLNDLNIYANLAEPMDWDYLTDTGAFYLGKRQSDMINSIQDRSHSSNSLKIKITTDIKRHLSKDMES